MTAGSPYTIFVPTNEAIKNAVIAGYLPGDASTGEPNFAPSALEDQQKVTSFIQYSILNKNMVATDGKKSGDYVTLFTTLDGDIMKISIANSTNDLTLKGFNGDIAHLNLDQSNQLGDYVIIHSIDKVLDFRTVVIP